ncbi:MAG: AAA family ATPase [Myxococcales bacterium]|nr:AAA family ATPase [Myxococcales bacterium]
MSMTFADAAELVLRDAGEALLVPEIWRRIEARGLVDTAGETPVQTLRTILLRQTAGSSLAVGKGTPRFYRRGDRAYGLWAELAPTQQQAMATVPATVTARVSSRDFAADREGMRADPKVAERTLAWLIPSDVARRAVAELLAAVIEDAHAVSANRWKLTLGSRSLRLTVGRCLILWIERHVWFPVRLAQLSPDDRALIEGVGVQDTETGPFRSIAPVDFYTVAPDLIAEAAGAIRNAVAPIVDEAARAGAADVHGAKYHSPGALTYLSRVVGRQLPVPEYGGGGEDDAPDDDDDDAPSLAELVTEYIDTFVTQPATQAYLQTYAAERAAARANLARIDELQARGADATDAILLGLLPYTDSAKHREAGAWVSHAPAIQGDFKLWFENAKWVKPETWPQVAAEILAFVRECLAKPGDLRDAIARFTANPLSKGFSVGLLTPILNALAPDELPLVNTKVTRVVSYFAGVELEPTLTDYVATIRQWRNLVENQPLLRDPRIGVSPGDAFDHFCHWLVAVKRFAFTGGRGPVAPGYWKISPGPGAELWEDWRKRGVAAIGGDLLGDLTLVDDDEFAGRVATAAQQDPSYKMNGARQPLNLARMAVGTLLVANRGKTEVLGFGRVTGPYRFVEGVAYCHEVPVDWFDVTVRAVDRPGWARTLVQLDKSTYDDIAALPARDVPIGIDGENAGPLPPPPPRYERGHFLADTFFREEDADRWFRILQDKKQIIVQGPPGTGKTWVAERLARWLVGGDEGRVHLVQFHPAYSYEDFIQGIRPIARSGAVSYELVPGRLVQLCQAMPRQGPVVLIIDEINRANLPRVFGELMYLLEYRERTMALAGGGELRLPPNLYLIGTMNTADRSIARLDHALRRRFSFLRLQPNFDVLRSFAATRWSEPVEDLIALLAAINKDIDDPNSELGISYFMKDDLAERLEDIWRCEIEPYLEEFFFDARATAAKYAWDKVAAGALAAWAPTR